MVQLDKNLFRHSLFFTSLSYQDIDLLVSAAKEKTFAPGTVIFHENTVGDCLYLLTKGRVEIWRNWEEHDAEMLITRRKGSIFGEVSLLDDKLRSATAVATNDVEALCISKEVFHTIIESNPRCALGIIRSMASIIRRTNMVNMRKIRIRNLELQQALDNLEKTQHSLLRAERLTSLGRFSSMILHDIRNPLSMIRAYIEMMSRSDVNRSEVASISSSALKEVDHLNMIAGELLDYSRGAIALNITPVNINDVFEQVSNYMKRYRHIGIQLILESSVNQPVFLDQPRISRVLTNLAQNAIQAMPNGGQLTLSASLEKDILQIAVKDTGIGIEPEIRSQIFEPFYTSGTHRGAGLGMAIAKNIITAHRGVITVESELGKGTTITCILPLSM